jgi:hypothetical protein
MKKLIITLALMAFLAPMTPVMARDANRDSLSQRARADQIQQKKLNNPVKTDGGTIQVPDRNPGADRPDFYDAPRLWEPIGGN